MGALAPSDPVGDPEGLLRRIPHFRGRDFVCIDDATGKLRVSSGLYKPDPDGISTFRREILASCKLGPVDVVRAPFNGVAELTCAAVRKRQLDAVPDPWPADTDDPEHKRNAAHALIVGLDSMSKGPRRQAQLALAQASEIIYQPVTIE